MQLALRKKICDKVKPKVDSNSVFTLALSDSVIVSNAENDIEFH